MAIKSFKPFTKSRRFITVLDYAELTPGKKPEKALTKGLRSTGGRNNVGRITTRFRGGGNKRSYRVVDFRRTKTGVPAKVAAIEYDPNRSAFLALHRARGKPSDEAGSPALWGKLRVFNENRLHSPARYVTINKKFLFLRRLPC